MKKRVKNKKAQVWIETVIYLLIAFLMIGMVLSFVRPKIEELKDKSIIEQSAQILENVYSTVLTMGGEGNKRLLELGIKKGSFNFDCGNDTISFEMESYYIYTEPGQKVQMGNIVAETKKRTRTNFVILVSNYSQNYNITYNGKEEPKLLTKASVPYRLILSNEGEDSKGKTVIDIRLA